MRVFALIPALNAEKTIGDVVRDCRAQLETVVVIDDGSNDATGEIARANGAIVLRHDVNRGKGASLKTGFAYAVENGFDGVITLDADGQHLPSEIPKILKAHEESGADLVIGGRSHLFDHMLPRRRLANRFSAWSIAIAAGTRVTDSQSGFRFYSTKMLRAIKLRTDAIENAVRDLRDLFDSADHRRAHALFQQLRRSVHRRGERGRFALRHRHIESAQSPLDGDVTSGRVRDRFGEELRRRERGSLLDILAHVINGCLHWTEGRADGDARLRRQFAVIVDGHSCGGHRKTRQRAHAPHLHRRDEVARIEVANERRFVRRESACVESIDVRDGAPTAHEKRAKRSDTNRIRRDDADAVDRNPIHDGRAL